MSLTTSDKVCLASAAVIMIAGMTIKKQSEKNLNTAQTISRNVYCSQQRLSQIHSEVQSANRALLEGNKMMRTLLTRQVDRH